MGTDGQVEPSGSKSQECTACVAIRSSSTSFGPRWRAGHRKASRAKGIAPGESCARLVRNPDLEQRRRCLHINTDAPYTTDTINAGLQLVMPNETAPAHRHVAYAMRFIIEGQGGFTAIHGKRITMQRGDLILTPSWKFHDHGKDGSGPMIWLDQLNLPSFRHFPVHFVEHYKHPRYPAVEVDSETSDLVFPWAKMQAKLDAAKKDWIRERYVTKSGEEGGSSTRCIWKRRRCSQF